MLNFKVVTWSLAIWTAFSYVFCVVYGLLTPSGVHMSAFLLQVLPGYELNPGSRWSSSSCSGTSTGSSPARGPGVRADPDIAFELEPDCIQSQRLAR